jgi:hypothetical protein
MSKNILFISEQSLKDRTMIGDNVDPKQMLPAIKAVQDRYIHPLLGTALYTKLQNEVSAGTVSGNYKTLLDNYITDTLIWYVLKELPMFLQYKYENKGVVQRTGETQQNLDFETTQSVMNNAKSWAEWYAQRTIDYLCANILDFPEYRNQSGQADAIKADRTQYDCGIFLGVPCKSSGETFEERYQGN